MARRHFAIVAFLLAVAAPLRAQSLSAAPAPQTDPVASAPAGPTYSAMSVAALAPATAHARVVSPAARGANLGQDKALMVVGVAALLAGAVIGGTPGTVIMIGGAVVGLVGLYDYLQ